MANAKIISFVDHAIAAAIEPLRKETTCAVAVAYHDIDQLTVESETQRADIMRQIAILTDNVRDTRLDLTNAIADNTLTLRHDINHLAAAINELRAALKTLNDLTWETRYAINQLRKDINQLELEKSDIYNSLAEMQRDINQLRADIDQLKQGGGTPPAK